MSGRCLIGIRRFPTVLIFALLLACCGFAQEPPSPPAPQQAPPPASEQNAEQTKPNPHIKITPEQAEQPFRDDDTTLDLASKDTSLAKQHDVTRRLASRQE